MSILVTGGAGFIGGHTAQALCDQGQDVAIIDNLQSGYLAAIPQKARFYQGDIRDEAFLDKVFHAEKPTAVLHFAACSQVGESMAKPLLYYDNNLGGTRLLLQAMRKHEVDSLVFSSSAAVYGDAEQIPVAEDAPTNPTSCYGETKLAMEKMMQWTARAYGLRYVALRYFNACGAHPNGKRGEYQEIETHLIPSILQVPLGKRQEIEIFGGDYPTPDGTCIRDYIHVCDLAEAHLLALAYLQQGGKSDVFNLGNGTGFSVQQVIACARQITGHPIPACYVARRPGDIAKLIASSAKAKAILGWTPKYSSLETILSTTWQWQSAHPNGYIR